VPNTTLKNFMSGRDRAALGDLPTLHEHCFTHTGVCRPGKTARDRAKTLDKSRRKSLGDQRP